MSFRKLAPNLKSHPVLVYAGAYKALFHLMKLPHQNTQRQAAAALRDLSANPEYKLRCAEDGGITAMIDLVRQQADEELQALGLAALRHISMENTLKELIVQEKVLRPSLRAITSNNEDIQLQCAGMLANLSELAENHIPMVEDSAVVGLVTLSFSRNSEIQQDTARALANLASNQEAHVPMYKQGAFTSMVKLSESDSDITQKYASMGVRFLSADTEVSIRDSSMLLILLIYF